MKPTCSMKIAEAFKQRFGKEVKTIKIKMLYTKEVQCFIRQAEAAHKATDHSKLRFKGEYYNGSKGAASQE